MGIKRSMRQKDMNTCFAMSARYNPVQRGYETFAGRPGDPLSSIGAHCQPSESGSVQSRSKLSQVASRRVVEEPSWR